MRAGLLRHTVTLQERTTADDGAGGVTETWVDVDHIPARVMPLAGTELFAAQQNMSRVSHRIEMRYRDDVVSQMRLLYRERVFDIQAVINVGERDRELHLMCEELR